MALSYKEIIVSTLLKELRSKSLKSITIQSLLDDTGISRQTFYNHFKDKNDLIAYVYDTRIIPSFSYETSDFEGYTQAFIDSLDNMKLYQSFLEQACRIEEPGCLKEHMLEHCIQFDLAMHQKCYGTRPMPETLVFATKYHAIASDNMTLSWILSGMRTPVKELAEMINQMRSLGMEELFEDADGIGNPYSK